MNNTELERTSNEAVNILKDFRDNKRYGEVTLKIEAGKIVRVVKTESIKP